MDRTVNLKNTAIIGSQSSKIIFFFLLKAAYEVVWLWHIFAIYIHTSQYRFIKIQHTCRKDKDYKKKKEDVDKKERAYQSFHLADYVVNVPNFYFQSVNCAR